MPESDDTLDLGDMLAFIAAGAALGIQVPAHLKEKLAKLKAARSGKLKVALVGGVSESKTSIAAAWLGRLVSDMKISQGESSDAVQVYDAGPDVQLIDTPGLFGFKEKAIGEAGVEQYREITRRYVSEADLLLYVLDPSNPIKESHREELNWLFRDLGLLARTVFVLGRFDMVADVEDPDDFRRNQDIKKANVLARLRDLILLTPDEADQLSVVAVAASPLGRKLEYWLQNLPEFMQVSRIGELRQATEEKVGAIGGKEEAQRQTCMAILRDVAGRQLVPAQQAAELSTSKARLASRQAGEEEPRLARYEREAVEAQIALRNDITLRFADLITEAKTTDMDGFEEFFDRKIGRNGIVVKAMVDNTFARELGSLSQQVVGMGARFANDELGGVDWAGSLANIAKSAGNSKIVNNTAVLTARDWIMPALKFKPYGAIKAASFANGALVGIGIGLELWSQWQSHRRRNEFLEARRRIVDDLEDQRANLLAQVNAPDFLATHFPQLAAMRDMFAAISAAAIEAEEYAKRVNYWAATAEDLCHRFGINLKRPGADPC